MNLNPRLKRLLALWLVFAFLGNGLSLPPAHGSTEFALSKVEGLTTSAQELLLPTPGQMVPLSPAFAPAVLKGIKLDPKDPFRFHFFMDQGDSPDVIPAKAGIQNTQLKRESEHIL